MSESNISRRALLRNTALAALAGGFSTDAAQHVHQMAASETKDTSAYQPKCFQVREYQTLDVLAELIVPGARTGGAKEFIDLLASANDELAAIFTGGLAWLDRAMESRHKLTFAAASVAQQTALLDEIAYRENASAELDAGIGFFTWARKMVIDAYYTSEAGIKELGYVGNKGMRDFQIPEAAIEYALRRSDSDN